jgi:hypothetical protein
MKKSLFGSIVYWIVLFAISGFSQTTVELDGTLLPAGEYVSAYNDKTVKPDFSFGSENEEHHSKPGGIVTGAVLISAGAAMGISGQILGKQAYHRYLRSAFTSNTNRLRQRVNGFNVLRVAGGICGGAGLFIVIFSF